MKDQTMNAAMEEFILRRVNDCGARKNQARQDAVAELCAFAGKLKKSLTDQQERLFTECENAFALVDGETMQCYYRAGFSDAVVFLLGWRDGEWN